ncbi:MAG: peptide/nickel transport system permease protein [Pyrinomonadaceae bacterium]|nr:peptide/nickel transport system permease protein [Pyrinomonadaceae bacterium]
MVNGEWAEITIYHSPFTIHQLMNRLSKFGLVVVGLFVLMAVFAPLIATHDVGETDLLNRYAAPSAAHWLGTDATGRDVFSRVIYGARISLRVGLVVVFVSTFIGTIIGALAGYYGGWIDRIVNGYLFNVFLAFPGLLLAIAMVAFLGAGLNKLILALCIIGWVGYARVIRGQVLKVREYDFVQAARALGASDMRILFVHILPNAIQPLIVQASLGMAGAVLAEATLSFLGLGVPPPAPSWGVMLEEARDLSTLQAAPHALLVPGIAIALSVLAFNFIGDGLREYLDPRQRSR